MVDAALTRARTSASRCVYGISANTRGWWDLAPGRALGYHPQDDAEAYAEPGHRPTPDRDDAAEAAHVGGPFAHRRRSTAARAGDRAAEDGRP